MNLKELIEDWEPGDWTALKFILLRLTGEEMEPSEVDKTEEV